MINNKVTLLISLLLYGRYCIITIGHRAPTIVVRARQFTCSRSGLRTRQEVACLLAVRVQVYLVLGWSLIEWIIHSLLRIIHPALLNALASFLTTFHDWPLPQSPRLLAKQVLPSPSSPRLLPFFFTPFIISSPVQASLFFL